MPGRGGKLPKLIEWWAGRIREENPHLTVNESIAIAVATAQKHGYLKPGTLELTEKGRKATQKYYGKPLPLDLKRVYRQEKKSGKLKKGLRRMKIRKALQKKAAHIVAKALQKKLITKTAQYNPYRVTYFFENVPVYEVGYDDGWHYFINESALSRLLKQMR